MGQYFQKPEDSGGLVAHLANPLPACRHSQMPKLARQIRTSTGSIVSKANTRPRKVLPWSQVELHGQAQLGPGFTQQAVSVATTHTHTHTRPPAIAYHPLVDLTPFSVATAAGWVVRKLDRHSETECQRKHTITVKTADTFKRKKKR